MADLGGIIPDIIDTKPGKVAKVTFPSGASVDLGKELTPTQVKDTPTVTWDGESGSLYTLIMVDPDSPSRDNPTFREIAHWLVINIPGQDISAGQTVVEYIGAGPGEGTGLHRYVFLVFKQAEKITTDKFVPKTQRQGRVNVKTRDYITKFNLGNAGNPVAGTYFQAQYDDYVPILKASIN